MSECTLCDGSGKRIVVVPNPHNANMKKAEVEWCLCMKSRSVSSQNMMLGWLGDTYLPLEEVDKQLVFCPDKLIWSPNLLIQNTNFQSFCLHIKGTIMKYRFRDPIPSIYLCKAMDILKKYYVEPGERILNLNRHELLIFTLDTKQKNDQLNTCVNEVVNNRLQTCKPTWIYLPKGVPLDNTRETSDELKALLRPDSEEKEDRYKKIELKEKTLNIEPVTNKVQRKAESFRPK
jgi:hypothetical protein